MIQIKCWWKIFKHFLLNPPLEDHWWCWNADGWPLRREVLGSSWQQFCIQGPRYLWCLNNWQLRSNQKGFFDHLLDRRAYKLGKILSHPWKCKKSSYRIYEHKLLWKKPVKSQGHTHIPQRLLSHHLKKR